MIVVMVPKEKTEKAKTANMARMTRMFKRKSIVVTCNLDYGVVDILTLYSRLKERRTVLLN